MLSLISLFLSTVVFLASVSAQSAIVPWVLHHSSKSSVFWHGPSNSNAECKKDFKKMKKRVQAKRGTLEMIRPCQPEFKEVSATAEVTPGWLVQYWFPISYMVSSGFHSRHEALQYMKGCNEEIQRKLNQLKEYSNEIFAVRRCEVFYRPEMKGYCTRAGEMMYFTR